MKVQFNQFAFLTGKQAGMTRAAAQPLAEAYGKADADQQADLRQRWMLNHLTGQLVGAGAKQSDAEKKAASIIAKGKGGGASRESIKMIDKAYADFRYNIVKQSGKKPEQQPRVKVAAAVRTAAMTFLAEFEGDTLAQQIDRAIAALKAMKV
jgi:hypothetical protein